MPRVEESRRVSNQRPPALPGVPTLLANEIQAAATVLRTLEAEAALRSRPAQVAPPAVPTPAELTQLQKDINQLSSQVRDSRRKLVAQTRGVEEFDAVRH